MLGWSAIFKALNSLRSERCRQAGSLVPPVMGCCNQLFGPGHSASTLPVEYGCEDAALQGDLVAPPGVCLDLAMVKSRLIMAGWAALRWCSSNAMNLHKLL